MRHLNLIFIFLLRWLVFLFQNCIDVLLDLDLVWFDLLESLASRFWLQLLLIYLHDSLCLGNLLLDLAFLALQKIILVIWLMHGLLVYNHLPLQELSRVFLLVSGLMKLLSSSSGLVVATWSFDRVASVLAFDANLAHFKDTLVKR